MKLEFPRRSFFKNSRHFHRVTVQSKQRNEMESQLLGSIFHLVYSPLLGNPSRGDYYYYYGYSALGPVRAETRAQTGDWYGSGTLHPGQILRDSLPLLSPAFRRSHFRHQVPPRPPRRKRS
jgi:hypothetical protein